MKHTHHDSLGHFLEHFPGYFQSGLTKNCKPFQCPNNVLQFVAHICSILNNLISTKPSLNEFFPTISQPLFNGRTKTTLTRSQMWKAANFQQIIYCNLIFNWFGCNLFHIGSDNVCLLMSLVKGWCNRVTFTYKNNDNILKRYFRILETLRPKVGQS